jgi:hypothetical protein
MFYVECDSQVEENSWERTLHNCYSKHNFMPAHITKTYEWVDVESQLFLA